MLQFIVLYTVIISCPNHYYRSLSFRTGCFTSETKTVLSESLQIQLSNNESCFGESLFSSYLIIYARKDLDITQHKHKFKRRYRGKKSRDCNNQYDPQDMSFWIMLFSMESPQICPIQMVIKSLILW